MEKAIGGYFELELARYEEYHKNALRLNSGKNCLEYILRCRNYSKVYIPYYTCDVVLKPFQKLDVAYEFYHINKHLELSCDIQLNSDEALLYTNYYGFKQRYVEELVEKYQGQLIVDNTQAFYAKPILGIDTFYTCRKFFGVPDGAYLYCDATNGESLGQSTSYDRFEHLLKRIDLSAEEGFEAYHENEDKLESQTIRTMSKLTQRMMQGIDYNSVAKCRRDNHQILQNSLEKSNHLKLSLENDSVPMIYPYFVPTKRLREKLIENRIFVACYWPNVLIWCTPTDFEYQLAENLVCIPIDQRYDKEDMKKIVDLILRL